MVNLNRGITASTISNKLISFTNFTPVKYNVIFGFFILAGLSFDFLNKISYYGVFSPMRLGWLGLFLFFLAGLDLKRIRLDTVTGLFVTWVAWNTFAVLTQGELQGGLITRWAQSAVILAVIFSIQQRKFCFHKFFASISPIWLIVLALAFVGCEISYHANIDFHIWAKSSIIGVKSNFSIFCSQFVAIFLFKSLSDRDVNSSDLLKSILKVILLISPFLFWQMYSSGRSGAILTILIVSSFFFVRFGWKGLMSSAVCTCLAMAVINFCVYNYRLFFSSFAESSQSGLSSVEFQNGILRLGTRKDLPAFAFNPENWNYLYIFQSIDNFSSMRLTLFLKSLHALSLDMVFFGYGIDNFHVTQSGQKLQPHMELLRHTLEIGIPGALIAVGIYLVPFLKTSQNNMEKFYKFFLLAFLSTTLVQPSGPLSHLNSAIVFWMVYASYTMICRDKLN